MKVRFLTRSAGPNGVIHPGELLDVPDGEAELLIKGGFVEAADIQIKPKDDAKAKKKVEAAQLGGEDQWKT